jgi:glycosyltransferase involved in cell wall biosynthesis
MKTLAICIPTYRRPEMLRRCILSAIASAGPAPIRIFIADDAMSDVNVATLSELCATYPFIRWQRNAANLGIDRNIQHVLAMSDCDHAWLIGEDDLFLPGAVARMVDLLQQHASPFIFSNYQYVDGDHKRVLGLALPDTGDADCPAARFIEDSLWSVGFIGSCVVECAVWNRTAGKPYDGTYFTHVGRVVDMLGAHPSLYFSARPAIANRSQGDDTFTWKADSFGVFLGFERMCRTAAERNPGLRAAIQQASRNYRRRFAYFSVKTTFRLRSQGAFDMRQYRTYVADCDIEPWRKAWMLFLACTPSALLKPFARAYVAYVERRLRRTSGA